ncbi:MAG: histidine kinase [Clostridiales bacterium]|nr:histidine kinase [Clostridiales bacterium]
MTKRTLFLNRVVRPYTRIFDITVIVAAVILFSIVLYSSNRADEYNNQTLANQPLVQLDNYLADLDTITKNAMSNELLIKKFSDLRDEADTDNHFTKNILDAIETSSILHNITGVRSDIFRISAYNDWGDFVSYGAVVDTGEASDYLRASGTSGLMRDFASGEREYLLKGPGLDHWSTAFKSDYLSFVRPIMNTYSNDVVGIVEIQKNKETLLASVFPDPGSGRLINIYDEQGGAVLLGAESEDYRVVASVSSSAYGWRIDLLEHNNIFLGKLAQMLLSFIAGGVGIIILVRYLVGRITRQIAKPLETLKRSVESIEVANPTRIDTADLDIEEVYSVANSFNTLMENVTFLMAQEKKAHLFALQAQMNPHFLYNILSVINAEILDGRDGNAIEIVGNLSDMLRYTSSYENSIARLEEEVQHTEKYLKLMKARYAEMFTWQIDMDDGLKDETVPKLMIQPLCENCFQHGFADIEPPYWIRVHVYAHETGWSIEVYDNGTGFCAEERASLGSKIEAAKDDTDFGGMQIGGLGLLSSIVRTRMVTGRDVECEITNLSPKGAGVKLNILKKPAAE